MELLTSKSYKLLKFIAKNTPAESELPKKFNRARLTELLERSYVMYTSGIELTKLFITQEGVVYLEDHKELRFREIVRTITNNILVPIAVSAATAFITAVITLAVNT